LAPVHLAAKASGLISGGVSMSAGIGGAAATAEL
jgi:hypothetical protein